MALSTGEQTTGTGVQELPAAACTLQLCAVKDSVMVNLCVNLPGPQSSRKMLSDGINVYKQETLSKEITLCNVSGSHPIS